MGTYVLGKARLVTLEGDAVGALAEVDSAVMLLSDPQDVVAHWNRLPACAARAGVGYRCEPGVARNPSLVDSGKAEVMNVY